MVVEVVFPLDKHIIYGIMSSIKSMDFATIQRAKALLRLAVKV
jgi:hypothetical protein